LGFSFDKIGIQYKVFDIFTQVLLPICHHTCSSVGSVTSGTFWSWSHTSADSSDPETVSLKKEDRQHLDPLFSGVRDTYSGSEHFFKNHLGHTIGDLLKNLENNANMLSWLADSAHGSAAHGLFSCTAGLSQTNILVSEFLPVKDSLIMYIYA